MEPGTKKMVFGVQNPHSPMTIGPMRVSLVTDGERVMEGTPEVGFLHRGIEKIAERMPWTGFVPFMDRVDYVSAIHCSYAYALALEELANIEVPERANYIRIITSELNRIGSHLYSFACLAKTLGSETAFMFALRDREKVNDLFEMLCGARLTYNYIRIGGVASDVTAGFVERAYELTEYLVPRLKEYHALLTGNSIFRGRLSGIGKIDQKKAVERGLSGPVLRASGVALDLRKQRPYGPYKKFEFGIPTGTSGDAYDRYQVRLDELTESCKILQQAIDNIPDGPYVQQIPRVFKPPKGEAYKTVESPRGIFGVFISSNGEKYPQRVRFRTPSFSLLNVFPDLLEGVMLDDVATIISSLDMATSEIDR